MDNSNNNASAAAQMRSNPWGTPEGRQRIRDEYARREAEEAEREYAKGEAWKKQTKGRLIATYTKPNDSPTPGANYGRNKPEDLKKAIAETQANTDSQWAKDKGVVGPTGSEDNAFFGTFFNNRNGAGFGENQDFAAQHDMQATDANLQANTWGRKLDYNVGNVVTAVAGVAVMKLGASPKTSLKVTKTIWRGLNFNVKSDYYGVSGGGATGSW